MLHHLRETLRRIPAPRRYGRIMALLLASLGGAVAALPSSIIPSLVRTRAGSMGVSLSLECSYAVSRAPTVPCARRWAVSWAGQRVGSGRLKAPNIALPGYRNDSQ